MFLENLSNGLRIVVIIIILFNNAKIKQSNKINHFLNLSGPWPEMIWFWRNDSGNRHSTGLPIKKASYKYQSLHNSFSG